MNDTPSPVQHADGGKYVLIEKLAADWHLHFVEWILEHEVSV